MGGLISWDWRWQMKQQAKPAKTIESKLGLFVIGLTTVFISGMEAPQIADLTLATRGRPRPYQNLSHALENALWGVHPMRRQR